MQAKYVSRAVPLTAEKLSIVEQYRNKLQDTVGFKVSLSDAMVHAIKKVTEMESEIQILSEELQLERRPKADER
jgi:hypothetical protein